MPAAIEDVRKRLVKKKLALEGVTKRLEKIEPAIVELKALCAKQRAVIKRGAAAAGPAAMEE